VVCSQQILIWKCAFVGFSYKYGSTSEPKPRLTLTISFCESFFPTESSIKFYKLKLHNTPKELLRELQKTPFRYPTIIEFRVNFAEVSLWSKCGCNDSRGFRIFEKIGRWILTNSQRVDRRYRTELEIDGQNKETIFNRETTVGVKSQRDSSLTLYTVVRLLINVRELRQEGQIAVAV